MEELTSDEAYNRDGPRMSTATSKDSPPRAARKVRADGEMRKARCLCGKWWAYRSGDSLVLRCKLCRRDIVISGDNLKIQYR